MEITVMGIDLAKTVFQLHGVNRAGRTILKKKISSRSELSRFVANLAPCMIAMEACGGSSHWARTFQKMGHTIRLIAPQFVKPYVKSNKNDANDAEAICEAASRPSMRFVPIKQLEQQDMQCVHRIRERLVKSRTALCNEMRGLLQEYGIVLPQSIAALRKKAPLVIEDAGNQLTSLSRELFRNLLEEMKAVDERVAYYEDKIVAVYRSHPMCQRIATIPGVGPMSATAIVAAVSDPSAFKNGRQLSAWLGLVPKQHSSGGKDRLLGISKRGDVYLRSLLIHGARSSLRWIEKKSDRRSLWAKGLIERRGMNRAVVALANKNARTIWALMTRDEDYSVEQAA